MNTAVVLNQSSFNAAFHTNEWRDGRHYAIYNGYQMPMSKVVPIPRFKDLSLGKLVDNNKWRNVQGSYIGQISMVPVFPPTPHITLIKPPTAEGLQHQSNVLQCNTIKTKSNAKSNMLSTKAFTPNPATKIQCTNVFKTTVSSTRCQSHDSFLLQNLRSQQNPTIVSHRSPSRTNPVKLTEHLPDTSTMSLNTAKDRLTRKRSSSWPSSSRSSKKKVKDFRSQDDQIMEEYKNLEMDVANILISDIPFAVVSQGGPNTTGSGAREHSGEQLMPSVVSRGRNYSGEQVKSSLGSGAIATAETSKKARMSVRVDENKNQLSSLNEWNEERPKATEQANGAQNENRVTETDTFGSNLKTQGIYQEAERFDLGSQRVTDKEKHAGKISLQKSSQQGNLSVVSEGTTVHVAQVNLLSTTSAGHPELNARANMDPVTVGRAMETATEDFEKNARIAEVDRQTEISSVTNDKIKETVTQDDTSLAKRAGEEVHKQANSLPVSTVTPANGNDTKLGSNTELKHSTDITTDSDASLQNENEKENYSKGPVAFTCQLCLITFASTQDLITHTAIHTSNSFSLKCNVCTQVFRSTNGLKKHVEFHADHQKNFQCSFCFQTMSDRDSLEEHIIASHMSKRPHKCSYCPKAFRDPGSLQKHIRIHTGERPYKCASCEKSFAEYSSLRKHTRVHTGEQPYQCHYCPKAFSISGNLQRHILIHTGERPYRCSECSKTFNNPSHLRRHEKNLHSKLEVREK